MTAIARAKFRGAAQALRVRLEPTPKLFDELEHPQRHEDARLRTRLAESHCECFVRSEGLEADVRRRLRDSALSHVAGARYILAIMAARRLLYVPEGSLNDFTGRDTGEVVKPQPL
jgi:hypothetical protein